MPPSKAVGLVLVATEWTSHHCEEDFKHAFYKAWLDMPQESLNEWGFSSVKHSRAPTPTNLEEVSAKVTKAAKLGRL